MCSTLVRLVHVRRDAAVELELHAGGLEIELVGVGHAADRPQHAVDRRRRAVRHGRARAPPSVRSTRSGTAFVSSAMPVARIASASSAPSIASNSTQDPAAHELRDLAAEQREHASELHRDVAAAGDQHAPGRCSSSKKPSEVMPCSAPGSVGTAG